MSHCSELRFKVIPVFGLGVFDEGDDFSGVKGEGAVKGFRISFLVSMSEEMVFDCSFECFFGILPGTYVFTLIHRLRLTVHEKGVSEHEEKEG